MEELQTIKRELTLIKVQIDGLLDNLDRMDKQRQDNTGALHTPLEFGYFTQHDYRWQDATMGAVSKLETRAPRTGVAIAPWWLA